MHRHSKQGWTAAWAFVSFFLVMSLLTPWALAQGWGMSGLFFAMVGAASVAYLLPLLFRLFVRRLERQGIGLGEWGAFMTGGPPQALYVEAGNTPSTSLLPYEAMDEEEYEEESEEEQVPWEEEDETEEEEAMEQQASGWSPAPSRWTPDHEDDLLDLAPNLQLHPNTLLGGRVLVAGMPGSGKTNTMRRLMEECGKLGLPFLLIDTDGEYASLLPYLPSGVLVGGYHRLPVPLTRYTTITPSDALYFGEHILSEGWQVIVDIKSYEERPGHPDEALAAQVFMDIMHGMRAWAEARPPRERIPSMIFLEEAQVWLPQQPTSSALDKRTLRELQALFFRSARDGRRRGIGLVLVAHRIAGIHKEVLMCDWLILHQPQATDLKRYCELVPTVHRERFQRLTRGRAIVVSPRGAQEVAFHRARSQDQGLTPGLPALRRYQERSGVTAPNETSGAAYDFPMMRSMPRPSQAPDMRLPGEARHPSTAGPGAAATVSFHHPASSTLSDLADETAAESVETPVAVSMPTSEPSRTHKPPTELERALLAWNTGSQSVRKLAVDLGIKKTHAHDLIREMRLRKWIS
jgi:hypothetical protein